MKSDLRFVILWVSFVFNLRTDDLQCCGSVRHTAKGLNYTCVHVCLSRFSRVQLFVIPWTTARQAPLSMGFSRQEYWSGLPCPPPGDLPDPGIKPTFPVLLADSSPTEPPGAVTYIGTHTVFFRFSIRYGNI